MLATKFGMDAGWDGGVPRGSRDYLRRSVEGSLERLRTDRIDLSLAVSASPGRSESSRDRVTDSPISS